MREIRPYGSARGVRSNPYPYRDPIPPAAKQRQVFSSPRHGTLGRQGSPNPAPPDLNPQPWDTDSTPDQGSNRRAKRHRIGQLNRAGDQDTVGPAKGSENADSDRRTSSAICHVSLRFP